MKLRLPPTEVFYRRVKGDEMRSRYRYRFHAATFWKTYVVALATCLVLVGMATCCFGAGPFGQWRKSDMNCAPGSKCCPQHGGAIRQIVPAAVQPYGTIVPVSPQGQYAPAQTVPGQTADVTIVMKKQEIMLSTVWITVQPPDRSSHGHRVGSCIAVDHSRGGMKVLILTYVFPEGDIATVGWKGHGGYLATVLASDCKPLGVATGEETGACLIEIDSAGVSPTYRLIRFDGSTLQPGTPVSRDGWEPVDSHSPTARGIPCEVAPFSMGGTVRGYRVDKMLVDGMTLKEGFRGAPVYTGVGLAGLSVPGIGDGKTVWAVPSSMILEWIGTTRVKLNGLRYTVEDGPVHNGPSIVLPGPVEDEPGSGLEVDISIPGESDPEGHLPEDDEIVLLLTEISNNVQVLTNRFDGLTTRVDALEMGYDLLEKKCKSGSSGPPGSPGPPGSSPTAVEVAEALKGDNAFLAKVAKLVPVVPPTPPSSDTHLVLVRDEGAEYWPRMAEELKSAGEHFSGIREVDPPRFATPMPRLIGYDGGVPVLDVQGVRNVSDSLSAIARGEFSFPRKER